MNLLSKTRKINYLIQKTAGQSVNFQQVSKTLSEIIDSNVFLVNNDGKIIGYTANRRIENERMKNILEQHQFPADYTKRLLEIKETSSNLDIHSEYTAFPVENKELFTNGYTTIVPIIGGGERIGTLILSRLDDQFSNDDLILGEYGATVVGIEIIREKTAENTLKARKKTVVQMAIRSLSYSELEAIQHIFEVLGGKEGLIIASKLADQAKITRSVIVNALRKLESAGVIESRSLGMKGTHIRVLNDMFLPELEHIKATSWSSVRMRA